MSDQNIPECGTCQYWSVSYTNDGLGECRRYAPRPSNDRYPGVIWPTTADCDWCGEYRGPE